MNTVYFSHSYRKEDTFLVECFGELIQSQGLIPGLDPPSVSVNAAKLERNLINSDGMVAILSWREGGVSQYILFEISLCLRARKPLLVFVENNLTSEIVPARILQMRFSRQSFPRQIREHQHAIQNLKTYIGINPPPKYQPAIGRRSCLLIGLSILQEKLRDTIIGIIEGYGYSPIEFDESTNSIFQDQRVYEAISSANLAVCFVDSTLPMSQYLIGAVQMAFVPTILLTTNLSYNYTSHIPKEFQPRFINLKDTVEFLKKIIDTEITIYEEDVFSIYDKEKLKTYTKLLLQVSSNTGSYQTGTNYIFAKELVMRDKYIAGQVGAQGPGAHAHDMTFDQIWNGAKGEIDLSALSKQLAELRSKLKEEATEPEHDISIGAIASAESSAKEGNGPKALEYLKMAGKWALDKASKIGLSVAAAALKVALGL